MTGISFYMYCQIQWTLVTMTAFVPKEVAVNLLLYRILNEQIDVRKVLFCSHFFIEHMFSHTVLDIC